MAINVFAMKKSRFFVLTHVIYVFSLYYLILFIMHHLLSSPLLSDYYGYLYSVRTICLICSPLALLEYNIIQSSVMQSIRIHLV